MSYDHAKPSYRPPSSCRVALAAPGGLRLFAQAPKPSADNATFEVAAPRPLPQAPEAPADNATFEVASVKANKSGDNRIGIGFAPGGRFRATNVPLRELISAAYGTPQPLAAFQITGGPKWIESDRFDIVAKAPGDPQPGPNGPPPAMFADAPEPAGRAVPADASTARRRNRRSTPWCSHGPTASLARSCVRRRPTARR